MSQGEFMLTISTFNCENLFSRPKLLNFDTDAAAADALTKVAQLDGILAKETYAADDKKQILELLRALEPFIAINQLRSSLFIEEASGNRIVVARGRASWVGGIELVRDPFPVGQQLNTARIVEGAAADIQCVVEVEDRRVLEDFNGVLANPFPYNVLIDGNDDRGIDVGLLSRFAIRSIKTHIFDKGGTIKGDRVFSRDCLEVEVALPDGRPLFVLVNHLKSKRSNTGVDGGAALRTIQAQRLAEIVGAYDLTNALVVVAGDFNDTPDSAALRPILSVPNLTNMVDRIADANNRWTYHGGHDFPNSQIDYLLASKPLGDAFAKIDIDRRGIFGIAPTNAAGEAVPPLPDLQKTTQASDHAAVIAQFNL
jgi:endonuclease/exonuclease/phosphatase family metal-dependent hydrolase